MDSQLKERSWLERFFDSFLQEKNIKWMLFVGVILLFGSSLMLVTEHWSEMSPFWKCGLLLAYTSATFAFGEFTWKRLGLRSTGTVLMALTLLLIPLVFFGMHRISAGSFSTLNPSAIGFVLMLIGHAVFSFHAGRRILKHFLREEQKTLLACYLILSAAGAVVPSIVPTLGATGAILTALILWGVFSVGAVKGSRAVFWLTETRRLPRIFSFFPVLLTGTQFATLFALGCAQHFSKDWMGFGLVLVSIPSFLIADAIAGIFQQRTGNLVRPLPLGIVLPLIGGLALCVTGMGLAATPLPARPMALVPAAALSAFLMFQTARRTKQPDFVWAMLVCVLVAYRFCPVYCHALVESLKQSAAHAVQESKLPIGFYGLTCMPLILAAAGLSRRIQKQASTEFQFFARPLAQFAVGLSVVLFALSFTHAKAVFVVSAVMVAGFGLLARWLNDRRLMLGSMAALIVAAWQFQPFCQLFAISIPALTTWMNLTAVGIVLIVASKWADRSRLPINGPFLRSVFERPDGSAVLVFDKTGCALLVVAATGWLVNQVGTFVDGHSVTGQFLPFGILPATTMLTALAARAYWKQEKGLGEITVGFFATLFVLANLHHGVVLTNGTSTLLLLAISFGTGVVCRTYRRNRLTTAIVQPASRMATAALLLTSVFRIPFLLLAGIAFENVLLLQIVAGTLLAAWLFRKAYAFGQPILSYIGFALSLSVGAAATCILLPIVATAPVMQWIAATWAGMGLVGLLVGLKSWTSASGPAATESDLERCVIHPLRNQGSVVLLLIGVASLVFFGPGFQVAGVIALVGLFVAQRRFKVAVPVLSLANLQLIVGVLQQMTEARSFPELVLHSTGQATFVIAALSGLSLIAFHWSKLIRNNGGTRVTAAHQSFLRGLIVFLIFVSLSQPMSFLAGILIVVTFACLAVDQIVRAVQTKTESCVWQAYGTFLAGGAYAFFRGAFPIDGTCVLYGILVAAGGLRIAAGMLQAIAQDRPAWKITIRPTKTFSLFLPACTVPVALFMFVGGNAAWLGANSLALLFAAGFYFWQGLEHRQRGCLLASLVILNVASALLCLELHWNNPQFFLLPVGASLIALVQLLKQEIPAQWHNPLRYIGALIILVSPTFNIVTGDWLQIVTLMVMCVVLILVAIGLRTRALVYMGTAFLLADLIAMVVHGSAVHPTLPWIVGLAMGGAVIGLAAVAEGQREKLLSRIRVLSSELGSWE